MFAVVSAQSRSPTVLFCYCLICNYFHTWILQESNCSLQLPNEDIVITEVNFSDMTCMCVVHFLQWRAGVCVTRLLLRNRLGCRVTSALWNFLICVAVNTQNDSVLGACRDGGREWSLDQFYIAFTPTYQRREPSH